MARVLPVGPAPVTSRFRGGYRSTGGHGGTDYGVPAGTRVAAASDGRVVFSGWGGAYGWRVVVDHGNGTQTAYNHLQQRGAPVGQEVGAGQLVGLVGSTGNSTGPHLDFEVTVNGRQMNPEEWLAGASTTTPWGAVSGGASFATTIERTGVRITPVQAEDAWESPNQVDITAADSRFGYAANESRFGMVAEEGRSIGELVAEVPEGEEMGLGEVEWQSIQGKDYVGGNAGGSGSAGNLVSLAQQAGFSPEQARIMAAIAMAESSGNPRAHNPNASTGDNSYGLWQINMLGSMGNSRRRQFGISSNEQLFNPNTNAAAARAIFDQQGFNAWSVYKSGAYRRFL